MGPLIQWRGCHVTTQSKADICHFENVGSGVAINCHFIRRQIYATF